MTPTSIVAYLVLFAGGAFVFLLFSLTLGRFLRAHAPSVEKLRPYECGEPAVGTSEVQFDLRFYVVALVFLIFDVEVAFFFPWAVVFGKANQVAHLAAATAEAPPAAAPALEERLRAEQSRLAGRVQTAPAGPAEVHQAARSLALFSLADLGVFFAVLLVGFAYVWTQGDLDWVRALRPPGAETPHGAAPLEVVS